MGTPECLSLSLAVHDAVAPSQAGLIPTFPVEFIICDAVPDGLPPPSPSSALRDVGALRAGAPGLLAWAWFEVPEPSPAITLHYSAFWGVAGVAPPLFDTDPLPRALLQPAGPAFPTVGVFQMQERTRV